MNDGETEGLRLETTALGTLRVKKKKLSPGPFPSELQGRLRMVSVHPRGDPFHTDTQRRWGRRKKTPT